MATPRILRLPVVMAMTGLGRTKVYTDIRKGAFPRPVALGPRAVGWREEDIAAWIESRQPKGAATGA